MHDPYTLVLTAAPASAAITDAVTEAALSVLGGVPADARWLSPGEAWEARIDLATDDVTSRREAIEAAIGPAPIDVNVVRGNAALRRKRLLVADMESTIIEQELVDEIADLTGRRAEVAAVTEAAMRGELDFEGSLVQRVSLFAGLEAHRLEEILERVTLTPGAETLLATMRANGAWTALVSGGFTVFAERIAASLGFHAVHANVLEIEGGQLMGLVREPILGPQGKAETTQRLIDEGGIDASQVVAVGDGANDVAMLAAAGLGVAFHAKPVLAAQARASANGAVIAHGDLTALLYLQGYGRHEFVTRLPS
ncbi:phosphoserine phosphatase SerB [Hyphomicrobium sp. CS1GBMeth3]|uniref:phosphoserine phosphatase SerB n=1 Tax=Hyphomicrobium sp. CS1GBMeth3 TaxID=1892845 RepID=UPI0009312C12|nr:phosphoserine phosphatase SerB [Hyphomicrobium sp. CS1GBMeth3]